MSEIIILKNARLKERLQEIWDIFQLSYEKIGGFKICGDFTNFSHYVKYAKVILNNNGKILATSIYRILHTDGIRNDITNGKLIAIGCDQTTEGKQALDKILIDDIKNKEIFYWGEVSGAIEHKLLKIEGALPIPNRYAKIFLSDIVKNIDDIVLEDDGFHYTRKIKDLTTGEKFSIKKIIIGVRSLNIMNLITKDFSDFEKWRKQLLNEKQLLVEENKKFTLDYCYKFIDAIYTLPMEENIHEIPENMYLLLLDIVKFIENNPQKNNELYNDYLEMGITLRNCVTPLKFHRI